MKLRRPARPSADPVRALERDLGAMEQARRERFYRQQVLAAHGRFFAEPAWTPPQPLLAELRARISEILEGESRSAAASDFPLESGIYSGLMIYGLWSDERFTRLEDTPLIWVDEESFGGGESYRVRENNLLVVGTGKVFPARELETWVFGLDLPDPFAQTLRSRFTRPQQRRWPL